MKIPVELLANGMDDDRILVFRKLVYPFRPERDGEPNEENGFDEDHRKFEVGRNAAFDSLMIGHRMPALTEPHEDIHKESGPAHKERAHEPVAELDNVIDLKTMLGGIGGHAEELVDQRETIHTAANLRRSAVDEVRAACLRAAKDEN